jgi:hypothetical protein
MLLLNILLLLLPGLFMASAAAVRGTTTACALKVAYVVI